MRIAGRINFMLLGVVAVVVLGVVLVFAGRNGPTDTANQFMMALAKGNVDKLMDVTFIRDGDKEAMRKQYDFATKVASPYYTFTWVVRGEKDANDTTASVQLSVWRNAMKNGTYAENFEIPVVKSNGRWLVDVAGINVEMYPALPR